MLRLAIVSNSQSFPKMDLDIISNYYYVLLFNQIIFSLFHNYYINFKAKNLIFNYFRLFIIRPHKYFF